ncbi:MAG: glutamate acetyltransferase [Cyanomargarita calcarea GSE-NOS-MK-12-04C]|uniref:Glutamate acetyltransferase n=1 Tax=Cyanomargarita calcarea GSE-NOS-MK-12-04C TaxID=2839659 RepID=A0A951UVG2_9CYAN|nr:glutamate acetyltransferase [Cyanomargarita calcarea GSE-NOS-MK-12-04C]
MEKTQRVSKYTALKQLVYSHLIAAVDTDVNVTETQSRSFIDISLYKSRDVQKILYISGVALQRSKFLGFPAMEIASPIASNLLATCGENFKVQIVSPGWIHLELTDLILAAWLENLVSFSEGWGEGGMGRGGDGEKQNLNFPPAPLPPCPPSLFTVQYAHARCCSLMRLAKLEGLIKIHQVGTDTSLSPTIPWLNIDRIRLNHQAERYLIGELVQVVDDLIYPRSSSSLHWEKAALDLTMAFEAFWCNCRIWGEVKTQEPKLAEARVGLVMATESVLRLILEEKLGISAPIEI